MNLTAWIDVAIGLIVVYLGASLFVTVINEYIAQLFNMRGRQLCNSLKKLICDEKVQNILGKSPILKPFLDSEPGKAPSYVEPNVLANLLVGTLASKGAAASDFAAQVSSAIDNLKDDSDLKVQLQALVQTAGDSAETLVKAVEDWANRSLTVLGESYKRNLQKISFVIGLAVAIGLNINTVELTEHLYRDKNARDAAVTLATQITEKTHKEVFEKCMSMSPEERGQDASCAPITGLMEAVQARNASLGQLPIGWANVDLDASDLWTWTTRSVGWLLTALALSLGAPFWFDLLNRLINMRHGMRRPNEKKEQK